MAKQKEEAAPLGSSVDTMEHKAFQRPEIPMAGEAQADTLPTTPKEWPFLPEKGFDPHFDPQLLWARKSASLKLSVPTYSLHQHEAINPLRLLKAVLRDAEAEAIPEQLELFGMSARTRQRLRTDELAAYNHTKAWTNRLIAGDSLLVMNSLLTREGLGGHVQCVYMDPPYGIKFRSNFMARTNKTDVKEGKDEDLTTEPEMIRAFRDTWELGLHSYLTYLRDRLTLARELLKESGSCFVQISMENVHRVRLLMDEVFGAENCVSMISYATTSGNESATLDRAGDYLLWYAKDITRMKYHELYKEKVFGGEGAGKYKLVELADGQRTTLKALEKEKGRPLSYNDIKAMGGKVYRLDNITSGRPAGDGDVREFEFQGKIYTPGKGTFKTSLEGMNALVAANRVEACGNILSYVRYFEDFPVMGYSNLWGDIGGIQSRKDGKIYVVQTSPKVIERCLLMTTDPGDLVLDPTCGSGTTAVVAEQWGRRWITMDTSRIALALAKRRLLTQAFDWYTLRDEVAGVDGGLVYKTVPHITLGSIANGEAPTVETLWDKPAIEKGKVRVTGPFTVEALPAPTVLPLGAEAPERPALAEAGEKRAAWLAQLRASGILTPSGERIRFASLEVTEGLDYFCAEGETEKGERALVCLGSESAPMSSGVVDNAIDEIYDRHLRPGLIVFAAFQFDEVADRRIAEAHIKDALAVKVQMNVDLRMADLLKKQRGDGAFLLVGQPDVALEPAKGKEGLWQVTLRGFDYYDPTRGTVEAGGPKEIAMWMLDPDYDGLCVNPRQIFFPKSDAWETLGKTLRGTIDPLRFAAYVGLESLPFQLREGAKAAVKIIDVRGNESLRVLTVKDARVL